MSKSTKDSDILALALIISQILTFRMFYLQKIGHGHVKFAPRQRSKSTKTILYIFIFAKVRLVRMIVTYRQTPHTHKYTEIDKPIGIGKILQIYLKTMLHKQNIIANENATRTRRTLDLN